MTDDPSSPESSFDATDLMQHVHGDGISARTLSDRLSHSGKSWWSLMAVYIVAVACELMTYAALLRSGWSGGCSGYHLF